jgi:hypothetical protein
MIRLICPMPAPDIAAISSSSRWICGIPLDANRIP